MNVRSNVAIASAVVALIIALGVSVAAPSAHALGFIDSDEDAAKCAAESGKEVEREFLGDMVLFCDTPEKDAACEAEFGNDYYYNYLKGECSNVPF